MFKEIGMDRLVEKSRRLTGYLEFMLNRIGGEDLNIITPADPARRGCQLSIVVRNNGRAVFERLEKNGVICDWREPDCIRVAPVPLYNSFMDVFNFCKIMAEQLSDTGLVGKRVAQ
jgi:kynureninase